MRHFKDEKSVDIIADALKERDVLIRCALRRGHSLQRIADAFHVSKSYVHKIARKSRGSSSIDKPVK